MRLIADENFPRPTVEALRRDGHDVVWVRTDRPGSTDAALLDRAEARVLLTLDKDFRQLALQRRTPLRRSGVILFRIHPALPAIVAPLVRRALSLGRDWEGHISVVTNNDLEMISVRFARRL